MWFDVHQTVNWKTVGMGDLGGDLGGDCERGKVRFLVWGWFGIAVCMLPA